MVWMVRGKYAGSGIINTFVRKFTQASPKATSNNRRQIDGREIPPSLARTGAICVLFEVYQVNAFKRDPSHETCH